MATIYPSCGQFGPLAIENASGVPQVGLSVQVNVLNTSTAITLYTDQTGQTVAANPTTTDSLGDLTFYAPPGAYTLSFTIGSPLTRNIVVEPWAADFLSPPLGRLFNNGNTTINASATTKINMTSTGGVLQNGFTLASNGLVVPVAGKYTVSGWINLPGTNTAGIQLLIYQNGVAQAGSLFNLPGFAACVEDSLVCAANDSLFLFVFNYSAINSVTTNFARLSAWMESS